MIYDVRIAAPERRALFDLQGRAADLADWGGGVLPPFPERPNTAAGSSTRLLWLGPETWLLMAPLAEHDPLAQALRPAEAPEAISIVPVPDSLSFFRIEGPEATEVMAIASPLDLHPRAFPENGATWAEVFGQRALILRRPEGFEIGIDRSLSAMTQDYLTRITS